MAPKDEVQEGTPDRYSVMVIKLDMLSDKVAHANALGLRWFATPSRGNDYVSFYIFFDQVGMNAYLRGDYE